MTRWLRERAHATRRAAQGRQCPRALVKQAHHEQGRGHFRTSVVPLSQRAGARTVVDRLAGGPNQGLYVRIGLCVNRGAERQPGMTAVSAARVRRVGCGCTLHLWMNCPPHWTSTANLCSFASRRAGWRARRFTTSRRGLPPVARCDTPRTQSALFRARGSLAHPELWSAPNAFALASTRERASWFPWWWHCGCRSFTPPVRPADGRPLDPLRRRPRTE